MVSFCCLRYTDNIVGTNDPPPTTTWWEIKQNVVPTPLWKTTSKKSLATKLPSITKQTTNTKPSTSTKQILPSRNGATQIAIQQKPFPYQQQKEAPPIPPSTKGVRINTPTKNKSPITTSMGKKPRDVRAHALVQNKGTKQKFSTKGNAHKSPLVPTSEKERQQHHTLQKQQILETIPPSIPVKDDIGKFGLMWPRGLASAHPAAPMLEEFSQLGCPVSTGEDWTTDQIIAALK